MIKYIICLNNINKFFVYNSDKKNNCLYFYQLCKCFHKIHGKWWYMWLIEWLILAISYFDFSASYSHVKLNFCFHMRSGREGLTHEIVYVGGGGCLQHRQHPKPSKHSPIMLLQIQLLSNYLNFLRPNFLCPIYHNQYVKLH